MKVYKYYYLLLLLLSSTFVFANGDVQSTDREPQEIEQTQLPEHQGVEVEESDAIDIQSIIASHLGDQYSWELLGGVDLYLPVIVRNERGEWYLFSSRKLKEHREYKGFFIAHEGRYENKIVAKNLNGEIYRPWDFSITKNVLAIIIGAIFTAWFVFALASYYKRNNFKAPRRTMGIMEMIVNMIYKEVIVETLDKDSRRFAPYLLTLFFFILISNLLGMIVVFPGGANITGNISVTMVLAVCTFVVINVSGSKEYWKDILWPDTPLMLKFPIPLMPIIEIFGIFTKPIALMIRLFANMMGGHMVSIVLISMIFLLGTMGAAMQGGAAVISVLFSVFMSLLHLLVAFIQAYVFVMLSTIFIRLARN